jgi:hypothetical protein
MAHLPDEHQIIDLLRASSLFATATGNTARPVANAGYRIENQTRRTSLMIK